MVQKKIEIITEWKQKNGKTAKKVVKTIKEMGGVSRELTETFNRNNKKVGKSIEKTTKGIRKFKMEYLGLLFAGMAIKRLFGGIARAATNSFTKIMEASGQLGTAVQQLSVGWEYLKFTVGSALNSALEPLIPKIMEIIKNISQWIQQHPKITSWIIILGLVLGTVLMIIGQFALGIGSLATALGGTVAGAFGSVVGWIILVGLGLLILTSSTKSFKKGYSEMTNGMEEDSSNISGVWDAFVTFFKLGVGIIGKAIASLALIFEYFRLIVIDVFKGIWEVFKVGINDWIIGINWLISKYNAVAAKLGLGTLETITEFSVDEGKINNAFGKFKSLDLKAGLSAIWDSSDLRAIMGQKVPGSALGGEAVSGEISTDLLDLQRRSDEMKTQGTTIVQNNNVAIEGNVTEEKMEELREFENQTVDMILAAS